MKRHKMSHWLLPVLMLLFIVNMLLLPVCLHYAYAGSAKSPANTLCYTTGKLTWDSDTGIRPDGTAVVDFFDPDYQNVLAADGSNLIAPGTEELRKIRLSNQASQTITYRAVVYRLQENPQIPLSCNLEGSGFRDTEALPALPEGIAAEDVLRAVEGSLSGGMAQDFDIHWSWDFEQGRDALDTALGNRALDEATLGFYIVVEDNSDQISADRPQTGDTSMAAYGTLVAISLIALLLLFLTRNKEKANEEAR